MTDFFEEVLGKDFFMSPLVFSSVHRVRPNPSNDAKAKQKKPRVFGSFSLFPGQASHPQIQKAVA